MTDYTQYQRNPDTGAFIGLNPSTGKWEDAPNPDAAPATQSQPDAPTVGVGEDIKNTALPGLLRGGVKTLTSIPDTFQYAKEKGKEYLPDSVYSGIKSAGGALYNALPTGAKALASTANNPNATYQNVWPKVSEKTGVGDYQPQTTTGQYFNTAMENVAPMLAPSGMGGKIAPALLKRGAEWLGSSVG